MKHYRQGEKRNCGQIAVAALTENTVEDIEQLVGHSHGTRTKELAMVLRRLNYNVGLRCESHLRFVQEPEYCLAQVHGDTASWHWIAIGQGIVYDGHEYEPIPLADYSKQIAALGNKVTSYLRVVKSQC